MRVLGTVARLQIQRSSLKTGVKPHRVYDPAPILAVQQLGIGPDGVCGFTDGAWIVDIHHRSHPDTKNPDGLHGISIGFTGHYDAMRERFGQRVEVGSAGENVIVTRPGRITLNDLVGGVAVVTARGEELLRLAVLDVAHPCKPFTGWASGGMVESDVLKAHLQFLEGGTRGFLCSTERSAVISVGDTVALLDGAGRTGKGEG